MSRNKIATLAGSLAAAVLLAATPGSALTVPAKPSGDTPINQVRGGHGGHGGHHGGHRGHGFRGFGWGVGVGIPLYSGSYYNSCGWLHRRAIDTGSRYWWRRYRECRGW